MSPKGLSYGHKESGKDDTPFPLEKNTHMDTIQHVAISDEEHHDKKTLKKYSTHTISINKWAWTISVGDASREHGASGEDDIVG